MKLVRIFIAVAVLGGVAGLAYVAQQTEGSGSQMVTAGQQFLGALSADQKKAAQHAYDSPERTNWHFIPLQDMDKKSTRKGLPLEAMTADQKKAALALVKAGTSETGFETAKLIMSLEGILKEQETKGAMVRNPEWYFVTVFGEPSRTGKWGWRFEGHHLAINFALDGSQVTASTPFFFGANPATVKTGDKKGMKVLKVSNDLASDLYKSLDADQQKAATQSKAHPEPGQKTKVPEVGAATGLAAAKMTKAQKEMLTTLLRDYADRPAKDLGEREWKEMMDAGFDNVHFAYFGATEDGKGRSYRIQGPTFVVEFLNVQADSGGNPANHIHSSWRRIKGDFGL